MLTAVVIDELIRSVQGAVNTANGRFDSEYVQALLPQLRAEAIVISYNGSRSQAANRTIAGQWLQTIKVTIPSNQQGNSNEFLQVEIPRIIRINDRTDGLVYVGNDDTAVNFSRAYTKTEVADLKKRGFLKGKEIVYIYTGNNLEIYGNKILKDLEIQGVFSDPTEISGFNWYESDYPVDEYTLAIMKDLFMQRARIEMGVPVDTVADGQDTMSVNPIKANTK